MSKNISNLSTVKNRNIILSEAKISGRREHKRLILIDFKHYLI